MSKVKMFEKVFKSVNVLTNFDDVLVSEGSEIKVKVVNPLTDEYSEVHGTVVKLVGKKMEIASEELDLTVVIEFSNVEEIEVL